MNKNEVHLTDGSECMDHEDCIVGNKEGLTNLIKACNAAIEENEYYGSDLGSYVGVKKFETSWFKNPKDAPLTRFANAVLAIILFALFGIFIIGVITTFNWLF